MLPAGLRAVLEVKRSAQGSAIPFYDPDLLALRVSAQLCWQILVFLAAEQNATAARPSWHKELYLSQIIELERQTSTILSNYPLLACALVNVCHRSGGESHAHIATTFLQLQSWNSEKYYSNNTPCIFFSEIAL